MAAWLSFSRKIFINELFETGRSEAGEMATVDDGYGKAAKADQGFHIGVDVGMPGVVDQRAVVDDVTGEENSSGFLEEADATGGVAGRVDDFEVAVAEINDFVVFKLALGGGRYDFVGGCAPALGQEIKHFLGGVAIREGKMVFGVGQDFCLCAVDTTVGELVVATDVIEVGVAGDTGDFSFGHQTDVSAEAEMAEARIEEKIAITAPDMPHVASVERLDPGLVDERHIVAQAERFVPVAGINLHGSSFQTDHVFGAARRVYDISHRHIHVCWTSGDENLASVCACKHALEAALESHVGNTRLPE